MLNDYTKKAGQATALLLILFITLSASSCGRKKTAPVKPSPSDQRQGDSGRQKTLPGDIYDLNFPTDLALADDGTLYFTERTGALRVVINGKLLSAPVAKFNVPVIDGYHETGLVGLALSPGFNSDHKIYVYHTYESGDRLFNRIVRLDTRHPSRRKVIYDKIPGERIHNGGKLDFGPDGNLYVSVGEANRPQLSRDTISPSGKILRLDPNGAVPDDNPFGNSPVFAFGLRNVFGMAFDTKGRLFVTENGPEKNDEVNLIKAGADYGWPIETGGDSDRRQRPLITYRKSIAPTGIVFYSGDLIKKLRNKLVLGDWNYGKLRILSIKDGTAKDAVVASFDEGITALAVGPNGALYIATASSIRRLEKLP